MEYIWSRSVGVELHEESEIADATDEIRKIGMDGRLATTDHDAVKPPDARPEESKEYVLGDRRGLMDTLRQYHLGIITKRTAKIAAGGEDDTGDTSRVVEEGRFLDAGDTHRGGCTNK